MYQIGTKRTIIYWLIISIASLYVSIEIYAQDFEMPHKFLPGDVISADVMNEVFRYIQESKNEVKMDDMVGKWKCIKFYADTGYYQNPTYTRHENGIVRFTEMSMTITKNDDGTYEWESIPKNFFYPAVETDNCNGHGQIDIFYDTLVVTYNTCSSEEVSSTVFAISKITSTKIKIGWNWILEKQNLPPENPSDLIASTSELQVTLNWLDNSEDEAGFKIFRKNNAEDDYSEIGTVESNIITYTDTVPASGSYWYRIKAINEHGNSLGSNVARVSVN
ncbi:MAG: hypothetical protein C4522_21730 [Desulfobacteraceae bacterium]|nr:MAG: hypothetical protein C4522_21730 [Desulfobacteraceae bacterium]